MTSAPDTGQTAACAHCGRPLTAEEQEFYGTGCERCETELHHAMQDDRAPALPPPPSEVERLRVEIAQLRSRLLQAEQGAEKRGQEMMCEGAAMVCDGLAEGAHRSLQDCGPEDAERWEAVKFCAEGLAAAIRSLALNPNQKAGDHEPR